ncbi:hypothetical protein H4Q26_016002 [Puccinia striiformis f. sp. tritici PST-130]|nr:hypothetical protein H4Q26_016002 [Puccinia striiformis f. sp. tritici PST-130]
MISVFDAEPESKLFSFTGKEVEDHLLRNMESDHSDHSSSSSADYGDYNRPQSLNEDQGRCFCSGSSSHESGNHSSRSDSSGSHEEVGIDLRRQHEEDQQEYDDNHRSDPTPALKQNDGSSGSGKLDVNIEEVEAQEEADDQMLRDKLINLLTCPKLINPSTAPRRPPSPSAAALSPASGADSSTDQPAHLLFKPLTLDSGYTICSACYDFYPHELPISISQSLSLQKARSVLTLDDHRHLAQSSPTVNFILQKIIQVAQTFLPQPGGDPSIRAVLQAELECPLCSLVFDSPVTISCGHTFCRSCFLRARDHADHCPVCRQPFWMGPQDVPGIDLLIKRIIEQTLGPAQGTSGPESAVNLEINHTIPLMVCSIGFPGVPMFLQIHEPKYKLLIRRCLSTDRKFGIVIPAFERDQLNPHDSVIIRPTTAHQTPKPNLPVHPFGTILEIRNYETAVDGRMLIEARGCDRFKIDYLLGSLDGYLVAKIHVFSDMPIQEGLSSSSGQANHQSSPRHMSEPSHQTQDQSTERLIETCKLFLDLLRSGSTPWIIERLYSTFGPMPDQPTEFSYWMAMVLPISDQHKATLLPIISYRIRLKILVRWIRVLESQWKNQGCHIT